ncbi:hypothetical protein GGR54DRAFT_627985 [Hypoxylon sp. NC1633]|nr:hypothetical protein GGR54DRAFT_627985 [Hypoxylon sp. NC1633]
MALRVNSIAAQLGKLSLGISRTTVRFKSSLSPEERHEKYMKHQREIAKAQQRPDHGEKIWIHTHFLNGMTVYSLDRILNSRKALRQIPYNGKKLKPVKLRKDYWRPLAMIQFPEGQAEVGRNVYMLMRECKTLHELSWGDNMFYDEDGKPLTKHERGEKINSQKANTIADMAAVLGGRGKGNKMRRSATNSPEDGDLLNVVVWWMNDRDRGFARHWSPNVTHHYADTGASTAVEAHDDPGTPSDSTPSDTLLTT